MTGVPLSSKATLVPSELPSQLINTWLQSSASMRGRVLEWTLRSISSSKLHWLDLPLRPDTNPTLAESCSFRRSEPSTRRPLGTGLQKQKRFKKLRGQKTNILQHNITLSQSEREKSTTIKDTVGYSIYFDKAKTSKSKQILKKKKN